MDLDTWATFGMTFVTFLLAIATSVMAFFVWKASKEDAVCHQKDRITDEHMHRIEHLIAFAHLEAEYLKGIKQNTQDTLDQIREEIITKAKLQEPI
jgi:hypothetical protein